MAGDDPAITRWTFEVTQLTSAPFPLFYHHYHWAEIPWLDRLAPAQDFEVYYEARLGIRREPSGGDDDDVQPRGSGPANGGPARSNGGADLAVFEQFERMVRACRLLLSPGRTAALFAGFGLWRAVLRARLLAVNNSADFLCFPVFGWQERKVEMRNGAMEDGPP
jgi:hypothetical protein